MDAAATAVGADAASDAADHLGGDPDASHSLEASLHEYQAQLLALNSAPPDTIPVEEASSLRASLEEIIAVTLELIKQSEGEGGGGADGGNGENVNQFPEGAAAAVAEPAAAATDELGLGVAVPFANLNARDLCEVFINDTWHPATVVSTSASAATIDCPAFTTGGTSIFEISDATLLRSAKALALTGISAAAAAAGNTSTADKQKAREAAREEQVRTAAEAVVEGRVAEMPRAFQVRAEDDEATREKKRRMAKSFKGKVKRTAAELEMDQKASGWKSWQSSLKKTKKSTVARPIGR